MEDEEFLIKVNEKIYGPIPLHRIISDLESGELTSEARFLDNDDWIPVRLLIKERRQIEPWNEDNWDDKNEEWILDGGPPLPASSAWEDVMRKGRWLMIYGDHLVIEGGSIDSEAIGLMMEGEPGSGGIPLKKLINVTFRESEKGVEVLASSFHRMYEVYTLKCYLSKKDSEELISELKAEDVRILF